MAPSAPPPRTALVLAHPGHELRVFGWLERERPDAFVLSDGSGSTGASRLGATTELLSTAGCRAGALYGVATDRELYAVLLRRDLAFAERLLERLADALVARRAETVVADAAEGYNPVHDLAHMLAAAAASRAGRTLGRPLTTYEFPLTGVPDPEPARPGDGCLRSRLDEPTFERKLRTARGYRELAGELTSVAQAFGLEAFRSECLRPLVLARAFDPPTERPPFYERYGEQQVQAGRYASVLRYEEHVRPFAEHLRALAGLRA